MTKSKQCTLQEPPDGGWGWVVVIGSNILFQCVLITRSVGVFFLEWKQYFEASAAEVGAVGSVHVASFLFIGPLGGYLCRRFGNRPLAVLSGTMAFIGMVLASQAKTLVQLMLSFGLLTGIGCGFGYISAVDIIGKYFKKRFGIANSISSSGAGLAIMVYPVLTRFFIDLYNWQGAMLLFAAIVANTIAMGMLFRPVRRTSIKKATSRHVEEQTPALQTSEGGGISPKDTADELNSPSNDEADEDSSVHSRTKHYAKLSTFSSRGDGQDQDDVRSGRETASPKSRQTSNNYQPVTCDPPNDSLHGKVSQRRPTSASIQLKKSFRHFFQSTGMHLIKTHHRFNLVCVVQILNGLAYSSVMVHFVAYAVYAGVPELDAALLLSVVGVGSIIGRLVSGPIVDLKIITAVKFYAMVTFIAGFSVMICPFIQSFAGLVVIGGVFGISTGVYKALNNVLIRLFLGADLLSLGIGLLMPCMGISSIVGPIFVGWLYDISGKYNLAFHISGSIMMLGAFSFLLVPYLKKIEEKSYQRRTSVDRDVDDADGPMMGSVVRIPVI